MNVLSNDEEKLGLALPNLYQVDDPEVGLNVVDLGLIYQVDFDEEKKSVETLMTLTTQFCPMGETITSDVTHALMDSFPGWEINIDLTFEPPWSQSMITPEGKEFLGF